MQSINIQSVYQAKHKELLALFNESYRPKLALYTCEELYYVYRICTYEAKPSRDGDYRSGDVFLLSIKAKIMGWLKGTVKHPIYPQAFEKLGFKFKRDFHERFQAAIISSDVERLRKKFNQAS